MKKTLTTDQKLAILGDKLFGNRTERLAFVSNLLDKKVESFKQLNPMQMIDVYNCLTVLDEERIDPDADWALFDKYNKQHLAVNATARNIWSTHTGGVDRERLSNWLKSVRSPVKKPLKKMKRYELSKVISALNEIKNKAS